MIIDAFKELTLNVPTAGLLFNFSSSSWDTREGSDAANGWGGIGEGERLFVQFECVTPLVDAGGGATGVINFAIICSDQPNFVGTTHVLSQWGGLVNLQAISSIGYTAAEFASSVQAQLNSVGSHFEMELPNYAISWVYQHQALPYLGAMITVPNYHVGGNTGFSAGSFKVRIAKDVGRNAISRMVRSRMPV